MPEVTTGDALPFDPETKDIVCERTGPRPGEIRANIAQVHVHHSPTGFAWGYGGSGPADLALNIAALFLPLEPGEVGVELRDGTEVSADAWEVYQALKRELVATLPGEGGTIPGDAVRAWLRARGVEPRG